MSSLLQFRTLSQVFFGVVEVPTIVVTVNEPLPTIPLPRMHETAYIYGGGRQFFMITPAMIGFNRVPGVAVGCYMSHASCIKKVGPVFSHSLFHFCDIYEKIISAIRIIALTARIFGSSDFSGKFEEAVKDRFCAHTNECSIPKRITEAKNIFCRDASSTLGSAFRLREMSIYSPNEFGCTYNAVEGV